MDKIKIQKSSLEEKKKENSEECLKKDASEYFKAKISNINYEGYGISRIKKQDLNEDSDEKNKNQSSNKINKTKQKYKLLIPYALEEEIVLTTIKLKKRNVAICETPKEISNINKNRVEPVCSYFGLCGGCFLQHMNYEKQLELKKELLEKLFSDILFSDINSNIDNLNKSKTLSKDYSNSPKDAPKNCEGIKKAYLEISPSKKILGYRNRVDLTISSEGFLEDNNIKNPIKKLSFRQKGVYWKTVPIEKCTIALDSINTIIKKLNHFLIESKSTAYDIKKKEGTMRFFVIRSAENTKDFSIGLLLSKNNQTNLAIEEFKEFCVKEEIKNSYVMLTDSLSDVSVSEEYIPLFGKNYFLEKVFENSLKIPNTSFFQVNTSGFEELLIKTKTELLACYKDLNQMQAIDLFCGVGTITLSLAEIFQEIKGYELERDSVELAIENAYSNNIKNAKFIATDLLKNENLSKIDISKKVLILDPPRSGIGNRLIDKINLEKPYVIVYISCNPKSQSEDIKRIKGYLIKRQFAFDIFPNTTHIENVLIMEKI